MMNRYSTFVGKRVRAEYRVAEFRQTSVGTLVTDNGHSITIEEHFSQGGRKKTMRVEIPYEYVIGVAEAARSSESSAPAPVPRRKTSR
jgi:hypothetical protein